MSRTRVSARPRATIRIRYAIVIGYALSTSASGANAQFTPRPSGTDWRVEPGAPVGELGGTIRWPATSVKGDTLSLAGDVFPIIATARVGPHPSALWQLPGGAIPLETPRSAAYPKLLYDSHGALHLLWGELSDTSGTLRSRTSPRTAIWHSVRTSTGWSKPELVVRGFSVNWGAEDGRLALDSSHRLHLIASVLDSTGWNTVDFRRDDRGWSRHTIGPSSAYSTISAAPDGSLMALLVSKRFGEPTRLYRSRSSDGGGGWSEMEPFPLTVGAELFFPRLLSDGRRVVALWVTIRENPVAFAVHSSESHDFGFTWSAPEDTQLSGLPRRLSVAASGCGTVAALVEIRVAISGSSPIEIESPPVEIIEVEWRGTQPTNSRRIFADLGRVFDASLTRWGGQFVTSFVAIDPQRGEARNMVGTREACSQ